MAIPFISPWSVHFEGLESSAAAGTVHQWNEQMSIRGLESNVITNIGGQNDYDTSVITGADVDWLNHVKIIGQNNNIAEGPK